jgi:hypothetical protein
MGEGRMKFARFTTASDSSVRTAVLDESGIRLNVIEGNMLGNGRIQGKPYR